MPSLPLLARSVPPLLALALSAGPVRAGQWSSFRGDNGAGVGDGDPPVSWNVATGENVVWKAKVEGLANASPIIWENRVFLATAVSSLADPKQEADPTWGRGIIDDQAEWTWKVICLDTATGKRIWEKEARTGVPRQKRHSEATHANCTPATDGKYVVSMFGSEGLYCHTVEGDFVWKKDFGLLRSGPADQPDLEWGFSNSPIIYKDTVVMECGVLEDPFIAILDLKSGQEKRRIQRRDLPTWSTPTVHDFGQGPQLLCNGYKHIGGYDLNSGAELWRLHGKGDIPVPRPIVAEGLIFISSAHKGRSLFAVKPEARGDITPGDGETGSKGLAWWTFKESSYMPVPLVYDGILYLGDERGLLSAFDAATGKVHYSQQRLVEGEGARYYASPVAAGGKIYFPNLTGQVRVVRAGRIFERLASNAMGESCFASPALQGDRLFIRTKQHLYCLGK